MCIRDSLDICLYRAGVQKGEVMDKLLTQLRCAYGDARCCLCLLYTSDAADERSSVDLGGRRIIQKKNMYTTHSSANDQVTHNAQESE